MQKHQKATANCQVFDADKALETELRNVRLSGRAACVSEVSARRLSARLIFNREWCLPPGYYGALDNPEYRTFLLESGIRDTTTHLWCSLR